MATVPAGRQRRRRHDPTPAPDPVIPPAPSSVDLHAHSLRSDGILDPATLVADAAAAGVRTFALTDHDTLAGYRELVGGDSVPDGLDLIPGVEINAIVVDRPDVREGELHILGFGMDPADDAFEAILAGQREQRRTRFERTLERLRDLGMGIDDQLADLDTGEGDALGRPTIARALIAAGHATSVEDAFRRWIGRGLPAYLPREGIGPTDAIAAIRDAGGLAALAHYSEAPAHRGVIEELRDAGLRGLEVHYISFDRSTTSALAGLARECRLVPTGGSDYHGDGGPYAEAHARLWVPPEVADGLRTAIAASSARIA